MAAGLPPPSIRISSLPSMARPRSSMSFTMPEPPVIRAPSSDSPLPVISQAITSLSYSRPAEAAPNETIERIDLAPCPQAHFGPPHPGAPTAWARYPPAPRWVLLLPERGRACARHKGGGNRAHIRLLGNRRHPSFFQQADSFASHVVKIKLATGDLVPQSRQFAR